MQFDALDGHVALGNHRPEPENPQRLCARLRTAKLLSDLWQHRVQITAIRGDTQAVRQGFTLGPVLGFCG